MTDQSVIIILRSAQPKCKRIRHLFSPARSRVRGRPPSGICLTALQIVSLGCGIAAEASPRVAHMSDRLPDKRRARCRSNRTRLCRGRQARPCAPTGGGVEHPTPRAGNAGLPGPGGIGFLLRLCQCAWRPNVRQSSLTARPEALRSGRSFSYRSQCSSGDHRRAHPARVTADRPGLKIASDLV